MRRRQCSSPGADPVLQDFHATSEESKAVIARAIEQKDIHVKEVVSESRLQTLISEEGFSPCACPSSARRARVAETDRRVENGKRFVKGTDSDSQGASRGMVCGWSTVKEIPPMPTDHQDLQGFGSAIAMAFSGTHWSSRTVFQSRRLGLFSIRAQHSFFRVAGCSHGRGTTRSALASLIEEHDFAHLCEQGTQHEWPRVFRSSGQFLASVLSVCTSCHLMSRFTARSFLC